MKSTGGGCEIHKIGFFSRESKIQKRATMKEKARGLQLVTREARSTLLWSTVKREGKRGGLVGRIDF